MRLLAHLLMKLFVLIVQFSVSYLFEMTICVKVRCTPQLGTRAYAVKPFYRGKKITVIGAISRQRVVALMTIDNSMNSQAFEVFIAQCLVPQLWSGAVVVMDNLPAHKVDSIKPVD